MAEFAGVGAGSEAETKIINAQAVPSRGGKHRSRSFEAEDDRGNVEYKRALLSDDFDRIDRLTTQLSFRLAEGSGVAQYRLGIEDDGCLSYLTLDELEKSLSRHFK